MPSPSSTSAATTGRRSFLGAAAATGLALLGARDALGAEGNVSSLLEESQPRQWDLSWVNGLKGKHKQVFDCEKLEAAPLLTASNYLRAIKEVYGLESPQVNVVMGIAGLYPLNAKDEIWAKYGLGEKWKVKDPATGAWATRNIYIDSPGFPVSPQGAAPNPDPAFQRDIVDMMRPGTINSLKERGAIFWQCNNALNGVVMTLSQATGARYSDVRQELIDGFLPGVKLVPAHTMMIGVMQERGLTYEKL